MVMPKKFKQFLEEQKAKEELEKYDIYTLSDRMVKRLRKTEKNGEYTVINDVDVFFDQFKK